MVTDKIKKRVMEQAMKFMASERGQKLMQNPQLMQAVMKAIELRGKVQSNLDGHIKNLQKARPRRTSAAWVIRSRTSSASSIRFAGRPTT
jgi:hypothetical protein